MIYWWVFAISLISLQSWHSTGWMQSPEDPIAVSLITRDEAEPQVGVLRCAQADAISSSGPGVVVRFVPSVWPPTPPCCRGGGQGAGQAIRVKGVAAHLNDLFVAAGVKLQHLFFTTSTTAALPPLSPSLSISEQWRAEMKDWIFSPDPDLANAAATRTLLDVDGRDVPALLRPLPVAPNPSTATAGTAEDNVHQSEPQSQQREADGTSWCSCRHW